MAIKAKRFSFLDAETNVAVADFSGDNSSSVFNSAANALPEDSAVLSKLIESANQKAGELGAKVASIDGFDDVARLSKDAATAIGDLAKMPQAALDDFMDKVSGGNMSMSKSLKGVLAKCKKSGMGLGVPGKPYDASLNCGNGKLKVGGSSGNNDCDAGAFSNLLSKLTGGAYNSVFKDFNSAMRSLMSLAGHGYKLGMCGVFGALAGKLDLGSDPLSKAAGALMSVMGKKGNTNAWLDISNSASGLLPLAFAPSAITDLLSNYKLPSNVSEKGYANLAQRTSAGLELVNEHWNVSGSTGQLSIGEIGGGSRDLKKVFNTQLTNRAYKDSELDIAPSSNDDFTWGAYAMSA